MAKHEPKSGTDKEGKPKFDLGNFLDETVRMSDRATRDLHFMAMNRQGSPKKMQDVIDAYQHVINRIAWARDDLTERLKDNGKASLDKTDVD